MPLAKQVDLVGYLSFLSKGVQGEELETINQTLANLHTRETLSSYFPTTVITDDVEDAIRDAFYEEDAPLCILNKGEVTLPYVGTSECRRFYSIVRFVIDKLTEVNFVKKETIVKGE